MNNKKNLIKKKKCKVNKIKMKNKKELFYKFITKFYDLRDDYIEFYIREEKQEPFEYWDGIEDDFNEAARQLELTDTDITLKHLEKIFDKIYENNEGEKILGLENIEHEKQCQIVENKAQEIIDDYIEISLEEKNTHPIDELLKKYKIISIEEIPKPDSIHLMYKNPLNDLIKAIEENQKKM